MASPRVYVRLQVWMPKRSGTWARKAVHLSSRNSAGNVSRISCSQRTRKCWQLGIDQARNGASSLSRTIRAPASLCRLLGNQRVEFELT